MSCEEVAMLPRDEEELRHVLIVWQTTQDDRPELVRKLEQIVPKDE